MNTMVLLKELKRLKQIFQAIQEEGRKPRNAKIFYAEIIGSQLIIMTED